MVTFEEDANRTAEYWLSKSIDEHLATAVILINQRISKTDGSGSRDQRVLGVPWR
jgi:hypothetical protein